MSSRVSPQRHSAGEMPVIDTVIKFGGGVLTWREWFETTLVTIAGAAGHSVLVVPGGGPFAEMVRTVTARWQLPDHVAHWMAVLAMDQYAHLLASRLARGVVVATGPDIAGAVESGSVPVLAPYRWFRECDPLPRTWEVTSDSIAAWIAGAVGARVLILIKPPGTDVGLARSGDRSRPGVQSDDVDRVVDGYFARALPVGVAPVIVPADQQHTLRVALARAVERA